MAVVEASGCSSNSSPSLGTSICHRAALKRKKVCIYHPQTPCPSHSPPPPPPPPPWEWPSLTRRQTTKDGEEGRERRWEEDARAWKGGEGGGASSRHLWPSETAGATGKELQPQVFMERNRRIPRAELTLFLSSPSSPSRNSHLLFVGVNLLGTIRALFQVCFTGKEDIALASRLFLEQVVAVPSTLWIPGQLWHRWLSGPPAPASSCGPFLQLLPARESQEERDSPPSWASAEKLPALPWDHAVCTPRRLLTEALPGVHEAEEGWEILVKSQHSHLAFHSSPSKKKGSSREPGSVSVHSRKLTRLPPSRRPQGCRFGTSVQQDQLWPKAGLSAAMQAPSVFFLWTSIPSFVTAEAGALSARHINK